MNKFHGWINTGLIALLLILVMVGGNLSTLGAAGTGYTHYQTENFLQGLYAGTSGQFQVTNAGAVTLSAITNPVTSVTADVTLTSADFGNIIKIADGNGGTITLPAVTAGARMTFVIALAFDTANLVIDSAEGDNIEGALIVAGAVVDCAAEDQINFVADGENLGDYVELYSDGTSWFIGDSGALTSAKLTCTDPS